MNLLLAHDRAHSRPGLRPPLSTGQRRILVLMLFSMLLQLQAVLLPRHEVVLPPIAGIDLRFPFAPGREWKVTNSWEEHNGYETLASPGDWNHNALDFVPVSGLCEGEPILAVAHGWIVEVPDDLYGAHRVAIRHDNGYYSLYVHLQDPSPLPAGTEVFHGSVIGACGSSGKVKPRGIAGSHIHFQLCEGMCGQRNGSLPVPIDGIANPWLLRAHAAGLYSTNGLPASAKIPADHPSWFLLVPDASILAPTRKRARDRLARPA